MLFIFLPVKELFLMTVFLSTLASIDFVLLLIMTLDCFP